MLNCDASVFHVKLHTCGDVLEVYLGGVLRHGQPRELKVARDQGDERLAVGFGTLFARNTIGPVALFGNNLLPLLLKFGRQRATHEVKWFLITVGNDDLQIAKNGPRLIALGFVCVRILNDAILAS